MSSGRPPVSGPWSRERIARHLDETVVPVRLACLTGDGHPLVVSLWFLHREGALWCAVQHDSAVAGFLRREPRCGFEVARDDPPYRGVRAKARASLLPQRGEEVLRALLGRYRGDREDALAEWLLSRAATEVAVRLDPERWITWDYSGRMEP